MSKLLDGIELEDPKLKKRVIALLAREKGLLREIYRYDIDGRSDSYYIHAINPLIAHLEKVCMKLRICGIDPQEESTRLTNDYAVSKVMET